MLFFIGQIFPYIAVAVFLLGLVWRVRSWLKVPVPFQITLFPAPHSPTGRVTAVGKEMLLFSSLRRGDDGLWFWAWLMHITLAMIIAGHIIGIYYLTHQFTVIGLTEAASSQVSAFLGIVAGVGFFMALSVLLYRRMAIPEVKRLSDPADYFELCLLLTIVITGMHMRTVSEVNLPVIREYLGSLIMLRPLPIPQEWIFVSHFFLVNVLMLYFPFSKLVHMTGFIVNRAMLVEAAPNYPTGEEHSHGGISRDAHVSKGGAQL
jgi:nitrate reductase gamma subunit